MKALQIYRRKLLLVLFCLLLLTPAGAQNSVPVHPIDGNYITEWLVLGPFFPDNLARDFLVDAGGEAQIVPKEDDTVVTVQGDTLIWKRYQSRQSMVDLLTGIGNFQYATAYAFCTLKSDINGRNQILLGSDDGSAVWINGKQTYYTPAARPLFLDHDGFKADFKQGTNSFLVKVSQGTVNWTIDIRSHPNNQSVSATPKFFLSANDLKEEIYLPNNTWRYHPGDNNQWAQTDFDDSAWEYLNTELNPNQQPKSGWQGVGWFRFHIITDSTLINKPLGLSIWQAGLSQIYLDGTLLYTFGEGSGDWTGIPNVLTFDGKKSHVIAVRYSNQSVAHFHRAGSAAGFYLQLGNVNQMAANRIRYERPLIGFQMFLTALPLAIGLLHLILFVFLPGLRQNLFFALFLFTYAAAIFFDYRSLLSTDIGTQLLSLRLHCAVLPFWVLFQLRFVYSLFYPEVPKQFWIISLAAFCLGALAIYNPEEYFDLFGIIYIVLYIEINRVIALALYRKKEGAWIIAMGFLVFFIFGALDTLMDAGIIVSLQEMRNPYAFGSIGLFIAMSVYLSRDFARANKKIVAQEMEQKLLEAENARQAKELEEARELQLSMLPKVLPQLPQLEIGVFMKTATEVGGDYYDFHIADNGTLTIAIGDATGHGMKAGTMVAAMKSLFGTYNERSDMPRFFNTCSNSLKRMNLGNVYMAMMLVKISAYKLRASAAGMPPLLIYRAKTGTIEEMLIKGMPLGGPAGFFYQQKEADLNPGDTILLMSDGFPELFNEQREMLDYRRVEEIFKKIANKSPDEIIKHLYEAAEKWQNERPQDDDITFVVLKVKRHSN